MSNQLQLLKSSQTSNTPKPSIDDINNEKFSQILQNLIYNNTNIEEMNFKIDIDIKKNENNNHNLDNQSLNSKPNPQHIQIYVELNDSQILNNWLMYEKNSDYQKLKKFNKILKYLTNQMVF